MPGEPQGVLIAMTSLQRNIQQPTSLSIDRGLAPDLLLTCKGGQAWVKSVVAEHLPAGLVRFELIILSWSRS